MFTRKLIAAAIALAFTGAAQAQDSELAKIREEIKQMKDGYEQRIQSLEKRLQEAEAKAGKAEQSAAQAETKAESAAVQASSRPASEGAFNPAVSLILGGTYGKTSKDPNTYQITGFVPSGGEVGPPKRSFSLGESELAVMANIDPYFRGVGIFAITPENEASVEEAYFQTLALPKGFSLKGGRFFSGIGYQNEIHAHAWDFVDSPLAYKAFLGGQLSEEGVQIKWLAPTDLFLEFGAEFGRGKNFPASDREKNGVGATNLFAHVGGDIGASVAWRAGLAGLRTTAENRMFPTDSVDSLGNPVVNSFTGSSKLWVADFILKWAPNGNPTHTNFKLQAEYFRRKEDGSLTYDDTGQAVPQFGAAFTDSFVTRQSGWYAQGVYQFLPQWRVGYRYDRLNYGTVNIGIVNNGLGPTAADFPVLLPHSPTRNTLMLDWNPTEFSRLRLQLARDESRLGATDNQVFIQYLYSMGAHGAHKF